MKQNQKRALELIGVAEGGYVNDPDDNGGATNHGVTQRTFDAWRRNRGLHTESVRNLKKSEARKIFVQQYFKPISFNRLPSGLDYCIGDFSIHSGPAKAARYLQAALGGFGHSIKIDGVIGENTLDAVAKTNTIDLIIKVCQMRMDFLSHHEDFWKYKNGWTNRVMGRKPGVQFSDTGVIDIAVKWATEGHNTPSSTPDTKKPLNDPDDTPHEASDAIPDIAIPEEWQNTLKKMITRLTKIQKQMGRNNSVGGEFDGR